MTSIELPDTLLANFDRDRFVRKMQIAAAVKWYDTRTISHTTDRIVHHPFPRSSGSARERTGEALPRVILEAEPPQG